MPGSNLTRDEARERAALLDVTAYAVDYDLTGAETEPTFLVTESIRFGCRQPGAGTFLDIDAAAVRSATLNGRALDTAAVDPERGLELPDLAADNVLELVADFRYAPAGQGLVRHRDPADDLVYLYSHYEPADAHRVFGCFDQPDLKAVHTVTVTAPAGWEVVANTPAEEVEAVANGRRWRFAPTPPMSTYITALMAGPYHVATDRCGDIDLGLYCRRSLAEALETDELFEVTRQGLTYYQEKFGCPYPFGKYDQIFVPDLNIGAMENIGAVTIADDLLFTSRVTDAARARRAELILHEMTHMWFGDLVTMRWWDDLWLKESFATFAASLCQAEVTRWPDSWATFMERWKADAYADDQLPTTHPISADIPDLAATELNFDNITYAKGASVLKQLAAYVGREPFLAGLARYLDAHAYGVTSLADLLRALEEASGRDLSGWSAEWLEAAGVNTLRPELADGPDGTLARVAIHQQAPDAHPTLRRHRLAVGLYDRDGDRLVRRQRVELDVTGPRTEVPELAGVPRPAVLLLNDDDLTYAKVRLDPDSLAAALDGLGRFADPLAREVVWSAAWDMARDAELPPRAYVRAVVAHGPDETHLPTLTAVLDRARYALDRYVDPDEAPAVRAELAAVAAEVLHRTGDAQLVWARAYASAARSGDDLAVLHGLLDGSHTVPGLAVDAELRWHLVRCLVAVGSAGEDEIAAALAADRSSTGLREAMAARSLQPTPEAKAATWVRASTDTRLGVRQLRALAAGWARTEHEALLAPYVETFFTSIGALWAHRPAKIGMALGAWFYPGAVLADTTVARTDEFLAEQLPDGLRRVVTEQRDHLVRALAARRADA
ncbi:MAG: aminopeptidase N [Mycobacteriales bacterium]